MTAAMTNKAKTSSANRILVVEDHAVVRDGFTALINREPDLEVCGSADTAASALSAIATFRPNLVVADLILKEGNGLDLIKSAQALYPDIRFLIISMQDEELYAERCIKAGASGYIMKLSATGEFLNAIHLILEGGIYLSPKMNTRLLRRFAGKTNSADASGIGSLSDRELQILHMTGVGMSPREIAPALGISPKTVANHRENIKAKLGIPDGRALLLFAMEKLGQNTNERIPPAS